MPTSDEGLATGCKSSAKGFLCSDQTIATYLSEVKKLERRFIGFEVKHVPRKDNFLVNELACLASSCTPIPVGVFNKIFT